MDAAASLADLKMYPFFGVRDVRSRYIEITGFNLLANYQDVHVHQVYAADTEKSRRKGGSSHAADARPISAKSTDSYSSVFAFLCVLWYARLSLANLSD